MRVAVEAEGGVDVDDKVGIVEMELQEDLDGEATDISAKVTKWREGWVRGGEVDVGVKRDNGFHVRGEVGGGKGKLEVLESRESGVSEGTMVCF